MFAMHHRISLLNSDLIILQAYSDIFFFPFSVATEFVSLLCSFIIRKINCVLGWLSWFVLQSDSKCIQKKSKWTVAEHVQRHRQLPKLRIEPGSLDLWSVNATPFATTVSIYRAAAVVPGQKYQASSFWLEVRAQITTEHQLWSHGGEHGKIFLVTFIKYIVIFPH